ncbi:MAG: hypothetical protein [Bacteriophage sp.]|nr:MAG: hypothetical protein [Bacteriophage sp.]
MNEIVYNKETNKPEKVLMTLPEFVLLINSANENHNTVNDTSFLIESEKVDNVKDLFRKEISVKEKNVEAKTLKLKKDKSLTESDKTQLQLYASYTVPEYDLDEKQYEQDLEKIRILKEKYPNLKNIQLWLMLRNITGNQLAIKVGRNCNAIYYLMKGKTKVPRFNKIIAYCEHLKCLPIDLLG